ncbi:Meromycolate extension acyl carrier protein [compost metagenome]
MTEEVIKQTIFQLLKRIAPDTEPSELKPDENIRETLNIDSFDALQFIVALDKKLGIEIPEQDYGKTTTLQNLVSYIQAKMKS